jgi:hypothetical protein
VRRPLVSFFALTLAFTAGSALSSHAQWTINGVGLCTATGSQQFARPNLANTQSYPTIASDGAGGAIVTWQDARNAGTTGTDIYVQRVNSSGAPQWTTNGVLLCNATGNQGSPTIVSDGVGGAIVTWQDYRSGSHYDIYAQRLNGSGSAQWTSNGVAVCAATNTQESPTIVTDGARGAIITWQDFRNGSEYDVYAQRMDSTGTAQWVANGDTVSVAAEHQTYPTMVSDGAGGAIVVWIDGNGIFAQRLSSAGTQQWTNNGTPTPVTLLGLSTYEFPPTVTTDGAGGAIATWNDFRTGGYADIYAQRVNVAGALKWTTNGVQVCSATDNQDGPTIALDGARGAIISWYDYRSSPNVDIYAQRADSTGSLQWTTNGVAVCTATNSQFDPTIVPDGAGGAIVTWSDGRNGSGSDLYAQRLNSSGAPQWTPNGVALSTTSGEQWPPAMVSDGAAGAIVAWQDTRSGNSDIYAKRLYAASGLQPPGSPTISVNWGDTYIQVSWTARGDEVDLGTPRRWVVYVNGDSVLGGTAQAPGNTESAWKYDLTACTSYEVYVRIISQDNFRISQSNTVNGNTCCGQQCDQTRAFPGGGKDGQLQSLPLALAPPRPNPAKDATEIRWSIPQERAGQKFQVALFDVSGRKVHTVAEGNAEAGSHAAMLRPRGVAPLKSGAYFLRLQIGDTRLTRSLVLGR